VIGLHLVNFKTEISAYYKVCDKKVLVACMYIEHYYRQAILFFFNGGVTLNSLASHSL